MKRSLGVTVALRGCSRTYSSAVGRAFEELDRQETPMGEIVLWRRLEPTLQVDVYEVKLGDEYLMSSLYTSAEVRLAELALAALPDTDLDIVVGGLGLGYTAEAVLRDPRVRTLVVIEALPQVIEWHERHLLPLAPALTGDPRCELVKADFFATIGGAHRVHAVIVDIDHSPRHHLHPSHSSFYTRDGFTRVADRLHPGGVFALWSDDPPDDEFIGLAGDVFATSEAHVVTFPNPLTGGEGSNTVYVCRSNTTPST